MSHDGCGYGGEVGGGHCDGLGYGDNDTGSRTRQHAPATSGLTSTDDTVDVHVAFHGACDVRKMFIKVASLLGLVPIDMYRPNLVAENKVEQKIIDWDAWSPPDDEKIKPSGWYPGATGWTRLWKEYWQIGVRESWWRFWEPLKPDLINQRTYVEVACVTWCYNEVGDLQTHLVITVKFFPVWDPRNKVWMYDGPSFDQHKAIVMKLAEKLDGLLKTTPPLCLARILRQRRQNTGGQPVLVHEEDAGWTEETDADSDYAAGGDRF